MEMANDKNKLTLMNQSKRNIISDKALRETHWDEDGIMVNEVAYSSILNALLRQMSMVTYAWAELAAINNPHEYGYGSYDGIEDGKTIKVIDSDELAKMLKTIILEHAADRNELRSKNLIWATDPTTNDKVPTFRTLVLADLPTIVSYKIGGGEVKETNIATDAVTTGKIKNANVTDSKLATDAVITVKIKDANVTESKIALDAITTDRIKNSNVTLNKLASDIITGTGSARTIKDELISKKHSTVIGRDKNDALADYNIVKMSLVDYNQAGFVKKPNSIYFLT